MSSWLVVVVLLLLLRLQDAQVLANTQGCQLCGPLGPSSVPEPEKRIDNSDVPFGTCGNMQQIASALHADLELCQMVQSFGSLCDCNVPPDACTLCWDGSSVTNPNKQLPAIDDAVGVGSVRTCGTFEAVLRTSARQDSNQCLLNQQQIGEFCGCPPMPQNQTIVPPPSNDNTNSTIDVTRISFDVLDDDEERCSICPDGGVMAFPEKTVLLERDFKCKDWERWAKAVSARSSDCRMSDNLALYCGCPLQEVECHLCPNGEPVPNPNREVNWLDGGGFVSTRKSVLQEILSLTRRLTCELMDSIVATDELYGFSARQSLDSDLVCTTIQLKSWICGCSPDWRQILLTWSYRLSGMLSVVVSTLLHDLQQ